MIRKPEKIHETIGYKSTGLFISIPALRSNEKAENDFLLNFDFPQEVWV